ncbi:D12 class N6 adenine-specific DNA methyltransferase [Candidatus Magnetobacterium bavaricum]|uniref:site-specific DNA-methyltransferase (adenine-specific) n=1 Tax=Candidatus Magnetobacterium bavaricum TaxID=29290 RepID=A0A0F3GL53_9BACT|nr:D12 class N6 adenine-specific DNA methyltransferase [Candidatus Magnetobacterium bavaricum]
MLSEYLSDITSTFNRGDAREESYYPALEGLLKEYLCLTGRQDLVVTTLPKQTDGGNPDFRLWDGRQHITGYIEAKEPSTDDLGKTERTEQLKRYLYTFPNLILTNFLEFRLYRNGELIDKVTIGSPFVLNALHTTPPADNEPGLRSLLDKFLAFSVPRIYDSIDLSRELAKRTRFLKDVIVTNVLGDNEASTVGGMAGFYEAFRDYLIGSLKKEEFANLYAQTVTYGLFAARMRSDDGFNREGAFSKVPRSLGILRDVFRFVSSADLPRQMEWTIDDISDVLAVTDVKAILHQYFHEGKGEDPVIHFYETFLSEYDPRTRKGRGVYYTPQPVVSYIVRSLNNLLKGQFSIHNGLAGDDVTLLDPAAGTCTFLAEASKLAIEEYTASYGSGDISGFIKRHVLQNFYGFELMMAPYAIGHIKMSLMLQELGYTLQDDDRAMVFITNTLDMEALKPSRLPGMSSLSEESHRADDIKNKTPILVILGNPPYSVSSVNKSEFIEREMGIYKTDVAGEKNIQPLSDDYIKFIRFSQWKIDKHGKGLIGMITNNSYLSGLIHRGMRRSLLESFDRIYILNLHGSSRIGEDSPDGGRDENVFDIQQGVSIVFFVRKEKQESALGKVYYKDLFGLREDKHAYLAGHDINTTEWKELSPSGPYYFFVEKDFSLQTNYETFTPIAEIFEKFLSGFTTHRDHFVVGFNKDEIKQRMLTFTGNLPDNLVARALKLKDTRDWTIKAARERFKKLDWSRDIIPCSYKPFDKRWILYHDAIIEYSRKDIMQHMRQDNISLLVCRQQNKTGFHHVFVSAEIAESCIVSNKTRERTYLLPLYMYLSHYEGNEVIKQPNIKPNIIKSLSKPYKTEPSPEEIFHYIYAVLYSNTYRTRYAEFLKIDFPRVPFTRDHGAFTRMARYGKDLVELHLLKAPALEPPIARFQGNGNNKVIKLRYDNTQQHLYINATQYFEGLSNDVWQYQIGGYQVCEKWLKDRKARILSFEEVKSYCKIVTALQKTINLQDEIDILYNELEGGL